MIIQTRHTQTLLASLFALTAITLAQQPATSPQTVPPAKKPNAIDIVLSLNPDTGKPLATVNGDTVAITDLRTTLRTKARDAAAAPDANEKSPPAFTIETRADLPYEHLAAALVAAAQNNIVHLHLKSGATEVPDFVMPAIEKNRTETSPTLILSVKLIRQHNETWVNLMGTQAPMQMDAPNATKPQANAALLAAIQEKRKTIAPGVQILLRPTADVPSQEVLIVYNDCQQAGFKQVAFAPPADPAATRPVPLIKTTGDLHVIIDHPKRIVYIIDHSASVADSFKSLKTEITARTNALLPMQSFDVIMLAEKSEPLFPELQQASVPAKRDAAEKLAGFKAQGAIDGKLEPFQSAFEKAFALKPDLIYFLTASTFDPQLLPVVAALNKDKKVGVFAIDLLRADPKLEDALEKLARDNGGAYKFISAAELKTPLSAPSK